MKKKIKKDTKIDGGDSMSQKTNEDFNKEKPAPNDPQLKPPLLKPQAPIKKAMKGMDKEPPKDPPIK